MALSLRKIVWGVDALEPVGDRAGAAATLVETIATSTGATVEQILTQDSHELGHGAVILARHADEIGADLIVVNTHVQSGMERILLGSFAESLIHEARCPVVIVPPHTDMRVGGFREILFPTELLPQAKSGFVCAVELARTFSSRLTLFHEIPRAIEPIVQSGVYLLGGGWVPIQEYYTDETMRRERRANAWARWARRRHVDIDAVVELGAMPIADRVFALARDRGADLIAMQTHTGPLAAALIGSIAHQVVRGAPCPVWVLGPHAAQPGVYSGRTAA